MMFIEQRADPRESLTLPLQLGDGSAAVTRDISASGMYIVIAAGATLRSPVVFEMHLAEAGMKFTAQGEIVRIEFKSGAIGVAVRLIGPMLESLE